MWGRDSPLSCVQGGSADPVQMQILTLQGGSGPETASEQLSGGVDITGLWALFHFYFFIYQIFNELILLS